MTFLSVCSAIDLLWLVMIAHLVSQYRIYFVKMLPLCHCQCFSDFLHFFKLFTLSVSQFLTQTQYILVLIL